MTQASKNYLTSIAYQVQEQYDQFYQNCFKMSNELSQRYEDRGLTAEVREVTMGEARETHFIVSMPSEQIQDVDTDEGYTFIDPTIQQYCLTNWKDGLTEVGLGPTSELPEVGIYPPSSEERSVWYYNTNSPN